MPNAHPARITWSAEYVRRGLPDVEQTIDPAWFEGDAREREGWSLRCHFDPTPRVQGNPSQASVRFHVEGAPHERLVPGTILSMFERGTGQFARVEVL
jgi:hypothetical protein